MAWSARTGFVFLLVLTGCSTQSSRDSGGEATAKAQQPISNGAPDVNNLFPSVVRLGIAVPPGAPGGKGCSGTMIAPDVVIAAAHCFDVNSCKPVCPHHQFQLVAGQLTVSFDNQRAVAPFPPIQPQTFTINVFNVLIHPRWVAGDTDLANFDVALVRLPQAVSHKYVAPMRLGRTNPTSLPKFIVEPTKDCKQNATDISTCFWEWKYANIMGYDGLPGGSVPDFASININGGLMPFATLGGLDFDNAAFQHVVGGGSGSAPSTEGGDSGGPEFVDPTFKKDTVFWDNFDPLLAEDTLIGVNSMVRLFDGDTVEVTNARLSATTTLAWLAPWVDRDGDSVPDHLDKCVGAADSANKDGDDDGFGDACTGDRLSGCMA